MTLRKGDLEPIFKFTTIAQMLTCCHMIAIWIFGNPFAFIMVVHLAVMWLQFAAFPAGFQKAKGKQIHLTTIYLMIVWFI